MLNYKNIGLALSLLGIAFTQLSIWARDKADEEEMRETVHNEVEKQLSDKSERE